MEIDKVAVKMHLGVSVLHCAKFLMVRKPCVKGNLSSIAFTFKAFRY